MSIVAKLKGERAAAFDAFKVLAEKDVLSVGEQTEYDAGHTRLANLDSQITRAEDLQRAAALTARPVDGQTVPAALETDSYVKERSLIVGGLVRMIGKAGGSLREAREESTALYGENHPVTRALATSSGTAGGFIVQADYASEIIELLRARAVVRSASPRIMPMPRGTMTLPGQASAASAGYGAEGGKIKSSQQGLNSIVASFKKLTALVPVSNDMMRYADVATDAFVRDDLIKVIALAEDIAFLTSDGSVDTPKGYTSFANDFARISGGSVGVWSTSGNSTAAVGGNFITSTGAYTLATVAAELGGLVNKLDTANVPDIRRVWFMHPRSFNYLNNVQNSLGVYVYRDELSKGTLIGYPFKKSTQLPINLFDATGTNLDCSFVILAEMDETIVLDSMQLELAVSREGMYVDGSGNSVSAFQNDQTLIRAIAENDFQLRHAGSVAVIQFARWAPAIS